MTEPISRSKLLLALVASLLLHLLLAGGLSGFDHTERPEPPPLIRAALVAPPAAPPPPPEAPPAPPEVPPPPKREPPRPAAPAVPEAAAVQTEEAAEVVPVAAAPAVATAPEASTDRTDDGDAEDGDYGAEGPHIPTDDGVLTPMLGLVGEARLEFDVYRGEGLHIGETRYHWVHDGERYQMDMATETTGLAALLRPILIEQRSTGEVTAGGLRPGHYVLESKQGKASDEEVIFDWDANRVMLRAGNTRSEHELAAGAQDMASLWLEIIWRAQRGEGFDLSLATGKRYSPRWFVPDEKYGSLETAVGRLLVQHIQARAQAGDNQIEVWLAPNLRWLPVRIRYTDRKGDVYDQRVRLIEYEKLSLRAGAAASAPAASSPAGEPPPEPANPFLR